MIEVKGRTIFGEESTPVGPVSPTAISLVERFDKNMPELDQADVEAFKKLDNCDRIKVWAMLTFRGKDRIDHGKRVWRALMPYIVEIFNISP
jgi:hypothetical protein